MNNKVVFKFVGYENPKLFALRLESYKKLKESK